MASPNPSRRPKEVLQVSKSSKHVWEPLKPELIGWNTKWKSPTPIATSGWKGAQQQTLSGPGLKTKHCHPMSSAQPCQEQLKQQSKRHWVNKWMKPCFRTKPQSCRLANAQSRSKLYEQHSVHNFPFRKIWSGFTKVVPEGLVWFSNMVRQVGHYTPWYKVRSTGVCMSSPNCRIPRQAHNFTPTADPRLGPKARVAKGKQQAKPARKAAKRAARVQAKEVARARAREKTKAGWLTCKWTAEWSQAGRAHRLHRHNNQDDRTHLSWNKRWKCLFGSLSPQEVSYSEVFTPLWFILFVLGLSVPTLAPGLRAMRVRPRPQSSNTIATAVLRE